MWSVSAYFFLLLCSLTGVLSLDIVHLEVPSYMEVDSEATLECMFNPEGQGIYSIKWFKDDREFYRFLPSETPNSSAFNDIGGIVVDLSRSDERRVRIRAVSEQGSGRYTCEVTAEAPTFEVAKFSSFMHVLDDRMMSMSMSAASQKSSLVSPWMLMLQMVLVAVAARFAARQ